MGACHYVSDVAARVFLTMRAWSRSGDRQQPEQPQGPLFPLLFVPWIPARFYFGEPFDPFLKFNMH
jgi:hypothetical protein